MEKNLSGRNVEPKVIPEDFQYDHRRTYREGVWKPLVAVTSIIYTVNNSFLNVGNIIQINKFVKRNNDFTKLIIKTMPHEMNHVASFK